MLLSFISTAIRTAPFVTGAVGVALGEVLSSAASYFFPKTVPLEMADVNSLLLSIGMTVLYYSHSARAPRQALLMAGAVAWAARLAVFLAGRIRRGFHDVRLDRFRGSAKGARAWAVAQTAWIAIVLLPVWVGMSATSPQPALGVSDALCFAAAAGGLAFTGVADAQKARFLRDNAARPAEQRRPFCDVGLFRLSRFPNYFGEWVCWTALSVAAFQTAGSWLKFALPVCPWFVLQVFHKLCMPLAFKSVRKRATKEEYEQWLRISPFVPRFSQ